MDSILIIIAIWVLSALFGDAKNKKKKEEQKQKELRRRQIKQQMENVPTEPVLIEDKKTVEKAPSQMRSAKQKKQQAKGKLAEKTKKQPIPSPVMQADLCPIEQELAKEKEKGSGLQQGESAFNPVRLFSEEEYIQIDKEELRESLTMHRQQELVQGIIMAEVLGPPVAKRKNKYHEYC